MTSPSRNSDGEEHRSTVNNKPPPLLSKSRLYSDWKKKILLWKAYSTLEDSKKATAVLFTLEGEAEEAALQVPIEELQANSGLDKLITKLDELYLKDVTIDKFQALEAFSNYKRKSEATINEHIVEFEKRYYKIKQYGTTLPDDFLAFKLLKSANLSKLEERITKSPIEDLTLPAMKAQLKKLFEEESNASAADSGEKLKMHDINESEAYQHYDTYYNRGRPYQPFHNQRFLRQPFTPRPPTRGHFAPRYNQSQFRGGPRHRNPFDHQRGNISQCVICGSQYHWANECPEKATRPIRQGAQNSGPRYPAMRGTYFQSTLDDHTNEEYPTYYESSSQHQGYQELPPSQLDASQSNMLYDTYYEIVLFQSDYDHPSHLKGLVAEAWNCAVLDSGATKTVCGRIWYNTYLQSLPITEYSLITSSESTNIFRFGDGQQIQSMRQVCIPVKIGSMDVMLETDIIDRDIPLLLSRESMKKAGMTLYFEHDTAVIFGTPVHLTVTKSGHYTLPLTRPVQLMAHQKVSRNVKFTLEVSASQSKHETALKLHRQFAHAPVSRIVALLNAAGEPWASDSALKQSLENVAVNCGTCKAYGKAKSRPVVGLPLANRFQETVALDLKFYDSKILVHMIDHATRLSSCVRIPSKKPEAVLKVMFSHWISIYGSPTKFLSDNGGEFINEDFVALCESLNVSVKTTGAESPWSNGLVERHNLVISEMLDKVLEDSQCDFDIALSWCVNAKNSLQNVHGFSPFQLAFGTNPSLPAVMHDKPPAYMNESSSDVLRKNLNALHSAREAFIQSERSERIRRALNSNTRTYSDVAFLNGDVVYYKRKDSRKWKGPATVLGKDGQQVLLKHGGYYVRVHPCKLRLANCNAQQSSNKEDTTETKQTESADPSNGREGVHDTDSDTSDSDDDLVQERDMILLPQ